ncbi:hypothetical protein [Sphingomonas sp.]|uniref:hypothetical protein n=1 Tax=Sphingomonas sp. TaxID=28214 RepID=UPI002BD9B6BD|nr:hypothetical protein [Sphingomonas sp.]HWK36679.1 hypothetical protein [Sphingomonas sp.]
MTVLGMSALIAAIAALVAAVAGRGVAMMRNPRLALAVIAGALGIAHWQGGADSRWLVGGILLIAGALPGWSVRAPRAARIAGLVLGLLGLGLYAIATVTGHRA